MKRINTNLPSEDYAELKRTLQEAPWSIFRTKLIVITEYTAKKYKIKHR